MQVFITSKNPIETVKVLDNRRLNKQIIECRQILNAINGQTKAWKNHPCTLQYKNHKSWLICYLYCLEYYKRGNIDDALFCSNKCFEMVPNFHDDEYLNQMKRRLYTKDNNHYKQWSYLGESCINWYFVDGNWKKYLNGKQIK